MITKATFKIDLLKLIAILLKSCSPPQTTLMLTQFYNLLHLILNHMYS